jgi:hypothetical protein
MNLPPDRLAPLPNTLEEAIREINYLRLQVYLARFNLANQIVEREKDRRAARGNIRVLADQLKELKHEKELRDSVQDNPKH